MTRCSKRNIHLRLSGAVLCGILALIVLAMPKALVLAESGIDFAGTVLTVDPTVGKFAVKKDGGGTRFTFVANDKTKFQGPGLTSVKDLKKDDHVVVLYQVQGSQYVALSVTAKK